MSRIFLIVLSALFHHASLAEVPATDECQCQIFVLSWKTSQMIRLPIDVQRWQPEADGDLPETCLNYCQNQFGDTDSQVWSSVKSEACRSLLANEQHVFLNRTVYTKNIRGNVQAYFKTSPDAAWTPMGPAYRHMVTCTKKSSARVERSAQDGDKKKSRRIGSKSETNDPVNSIDVQSVIDDSVPNTASQSNAANPSAGVSVVNGGAGSGHRPFLVNILPVKVALKRVSVLAPYVDEVVGTDNHVDIGGILNRLRMGGLVDRYQDASSRYGDEVDAGHCFLEYVLYSLFNHRFTTTSSATAAAAERSRGLEETITSVLMDTATQFLGADNSTQLLTKLYHQFSPLISQVVKKNALQNPSPPPPPPPPPSQLSQKDDSNSISAPEPTPEVKDVAMKIARFYLRTYFSSLAGSTVRVNDQDPNNNPDSLADMVEQVSRPFFLSVFGIVPGVPASGRMDPATLFADNEDNNHRNHLENRLKSVEPPSPIYNKNQLPKTGNLLFDFGNSLVATFQRASDATSALYCVKQYMANKVWDRYRGSVRKVLKVIPSAATG